MRKPSKEDLAKASDAVVTVSKAAGRKVAQGLAKGSDVVVSGSKTAIRKAAEGIGEGATVISGQAGALSARISEGLADAVDQVVQQKRAQWCNDRGGPPPVADMDAIIANSANLNAAVAGGVSLIPGPWGMAAAVPEVVLILRNQVAMICDLIAAAGKPGIISKELVLGILLSSSGIVGIGLLTIHGGKVVIRRASLRVLQKIIVLLGGRVTQQLLKSMISKWLPVVGAVAMAAWARVSTKRLGEQAKSILSQDVLFEGELAEDDLTADVEMTEPTSTALTELHIMTLINLMKVDRRIHDEETAFIETLIVDAGVPDEVVGRLRSMMHSTDSVPVPFEQLVPHPEESLALLMDMVALANRDGELHPAERAYVRRVGVLLGHSDEDLKALLEHG